MPERRFQAVKVLTACLISQIERLGVSVTLRVASALDDNLGSISGNTLTVVEDKTQPEITAFTLCHLFGHLIQLTEWQRYRHLIEPVSGKPPVTLTDSFWAAFYAYENEAFAYGATLLTRCRCDSELTGKYAKFLDVDFQHFRRYVSTGIKNSREDYRSLGQAAFAVSDGGKVIAPMPIPPLDWSKLPEGPIAII